MAIRKQDCGEDEVVISDDAVVYNRGKVAAVFHDADFGSDVDGVRR